MDWRESSTIKQVIRTTFDEARALVSLLPSKTYTEQCVAKDTFYTAFRKMLNAKGYDWAEYIPFGEECPNDLKRLFDILHDNGIEYAFFDRRLVVALKDKERASTLARDFLCEIEAKRGPLACFY